MSSSAKLYQLMSSKLPAKNFSSPSRFAIDKTKPVLIPKDSSITSLGQDFNSFLFSVPMISDWPFWKVPSFSSTLLITTTITTMPGGYELTDMDVLTITITITTTIITTMPGGYELTDMDNWTCSSSSSCSSPPCQVVTSWRTWTCSSSKRCTDATGPVGVGQSQRTEVFPTKS